MTLKSRWLTKTGLFFLLCYLTIGVSCISVPHHLYFRTQEDRAEADHRAGEKETGHTTCWFLQLWK